MQEVLGHYRDAIFATDDYHLGGDSKGNGCRYQDYSDAAKKHKVLYPCPVDGGLMSAAASVGGAISILAFDSTFDDNADAFSVGVCVVRSQRPGGRSVDALAAQLRSAGSTQG